MGKGERAPPSPNPYLLWMRASRWSPWPSLAVSKLQSPLLSPPSLLLFLLECEIVERDELEREWECKNE